MATFYGNLGDAFNKGVGNVHVQSDGKIIITGIFTTLDNISRNWNVRLNSDGTVDTTWYTNYSAGADNWENVSDISSTNELFVRSSDSGRTPYLKKYSIAGSNDTTFETNQGTGVGSGTINHIFVQADGKILVGGFFYSWDGTTVNTVLRLNSNGTLDTSFSTNANNVITLYESGSTISLFEQSDNKIVVGGEWYTEGNVNTLYRLNSTGTEDTTFSTNIGTGPNSRTHAISQQSDGKLILGGDFTTFNGTTKNKLVRLNTTGTVDTAFYTNLGTGFNDRIEVIKIQTDGKILVGGHFTSLNGNTRNRLVRLNSDGTEDTSFYTNLGSAFNDVVLDIDLQTDGKILIGGFFTSFDGKVRWRLIRLNSNGTEDDSNGELPTITPSSIELNGISLDSGLVNDVTIIPIEKINYINSARVPDRIAPGAATSLSSSQICQTEFLLSWTAPSDNDIAYYKLERESAPSTFEQWDIIPGDETSFIVSGITVGSTNDWALITVDQEGNESSRSSEIRVTQGNDVFQADITTTGQGSAFDACTQFTTTVRYYNGTVLLPANGDIVYTDSCGTTKFNGGGSYYKLLGFTDYSMTISSTGVVGNVTPCL